MKKAKERQTLVFCLRHFDGWTFQRIGDWLGIGIGRASQLYRMQHWDYSYTPRRRLALMRFYADAIRDGFEIERTPKQTTKRWTRERLAEVYILRKRGITYADIGKRYGVTGARAQQVFASADRIIRHGRMPVEAFNASMRRVNGE